MSMTLRVWALASIVLLGPVAGLPVPTLRELHAPIVIEGDPALPGNPLVTGVVSGAGTPDDPYVIEGWTVVGPIHLKDTTKHIVIRNVDVVATVVVENVAYPEVYGRHLGRGVTLEDVGNVTITAVHTSLPYDAVTVRGGRDILIAANDFRPAPQPISSGYGVFLRDAVRVTIIGNTFHVVDGIAALDAQDIVVQGNEFPGAELGMTARGITRLRIVDNHIPDPFNAFLLASPMDDVVVARNDIGGGAVAISFSHDTGNSRRILLCENTVAGASTAMALGGVQDAWVGGNIIRGHTNVGLRLLDVGGASVANVTVTGNDIGDSGPGPNLWGILLGVDAPLVVTDNRLHGNQGYGLDADHPADATMNWWGHPSGPSGIGPGSGDRLRGPVSFEPWRTEPPALATCPDGLAPWKDSYPEWRGPPR